MPAKPPKGRKIRGGPVRAFEVADRYEHAKDNLSALADKGHDVRLIQDYLGHRDPRHTVHSARTARRWFEGLWGR